MTPPELMEVLLIGVPLDIQRQANAALRRADA